MKCQVVYIISNINKALAFEWIAEELDKDRFALSFILLNPGDSVLEQYLKEKGIDVYRITYRGKKDFLGALWRVTRTITRLRAQIIHTHLFDASLIGLLAGKLAGISKRIYTRHHGSMHHEYFPKAVYYDKIINYLASDIVAISANVRNILIEKEYVSPKKITLIHHGFPLQEFHQVSADRVEQLVEKYELKGCWPIVGVISRYLHLKGLQYIIPAFEQLLLQYPNACLLLANAKGSYKKEVQQLLSDIPAKSYREILFEEDIFALYKLFNIFVHVPINDSVEAFGQTYVEAIAAGVPSVFTLSGVATEFIRDGENAWVVPFMDADAIYKKCEWILQHPTLARTMMEKNFEKVEGVFGIEKMIEKLEKLYSKNRV